MDDAKSIRWMRFRTVSTKN